jgi:hypothetical protein
LAIVFLISLTLAQSPNPAAKSASSLQIEISPMAGYFFGGSVKFYEGKLKINDNASFGVAVGLPLSNGTLLEFSYTGISSTAEWRPSYAYDIKYPARNFGMNVNYFNLGGLRRLPLADNIEGFGAMRAGAVYFNSTANDVDDVWRFEVSLGGGIKVYLSDKIGLRFQGNMHLPLILSGGGLFCGIGTGGSNCSVGVSSTSSIIQGDLSAGLVFRLGK